MPKIQMGSMAAPLFSIEMKRKKIKRNDQGLIDGIVYKRTLLTDCAEKGYCYIGDSMDEQERIHSWNNKSNNSYGGAKITEARQKYGVQDWSYEVLERRTGADEDELQKLLDDIEGEYVEKFDSIQHGFNTSKKGASNYVHTPEQTLKMVKTRKANGSYKHTEETKEKIRQKNRGRKLSPETRTKISTSNKGKTKSPETIEKLRKALKGRVISPEARAKSRATKLGKPNHISAQGMANINAARYKVPVVVILPDGEIQEYSSMKAVQEKLHYAPGSVSHYIKTGNKTKEGYTFAYKDGIKNLPKRKSA